MATICQICDNTNFKYSCPKCNILFCSVECYKNPKHKNCSELFYKNCVTEELLFNQLPNCQSSPDANKIVDILQRTAFNDNNAQADNLHEDDFNSFDAAAAEIEDDTEYNDIDSDDDDDLGKRLQNINLNNPDEVWKHLTENEKQEFESLLHNGEILSLLPIFKPWWEIKVQKKLIEEVNESNQYVNTADVPAILENIVPFNLLSSKPPSPCLQHNICNILAAFSCTIRFFHGECFSHINEAAFYLFTLSSTLSKNENFNSKEEAIKSVIHESESGTLNLPFEDFQKINEDVNNILEGPIQGGRDESYVLSALTDLHKLLMQAKQQASIPNIKKIEGEFAKRFSNCDLRKIERKQLKLIIKKIEFYVSFVKYHYMEILI